MLFRFFIVSLYFLKSLQISGTEPKTGHRIVRKFSFYCQGQIWSFLALYANIFGVSECQEDRNPTFHEETDRRTRQKIQDLRNRSHIWKGNPRLLGSVRFRTYNHAGQGSGSLLLKLSPELASTEPALAQYPAQQITLYRFPSWLSPIIIC